MRFLRRWFGAHAADRNGEAPAETQAGAIPYTVVEGEPLFLLVTSRGNGRWIFPKGRLDPGKTAAEIAVQEAFEEAGVEGRVGAPVGRYRFRRGRDANAPLIEVEMYPLAVGRQLDDWPEKAERRRHWASAAEVRRLVIDPGLADLAAEVGRAATAAPAASLPSGN